MTTGLGETVIRQAAVTNPRPCVLAAEDLSLVQQWRTNVLITGAPDRTAEALDELGTCMQTPIERWTPGKALKLPADASTKTLILTEPSLMSLDEQHELLAWMNNNRAVQIVTITSVPLFGLIATGAFSHQLYYHLNLVHFEVGH